MTLHISSPIDSETIETLRAGDQVLISGIVYVGRDSAHKRIVEALDRGDDLPFDVQGQTIYYMGPSPTKPGQVIGSAGPTTSGRMDAYAPRLLAIGLKAMIGKGARSDAVKEAIREHKAVYFAAVGGAGALAAKRIVRAETVAQEDCPGGDSCVRGAWTGSSAAAGSAGFSGCGGERHIWWRSVRAGQGHIPSCGGDDKPVMGAEEAKMGVDLEWNDDDVVPPQVTPDLVFLFDRMIEATIAKVDPTRGDKVLDVGCGRAVDAIQMARKGGKPVGIEPSRTMLGHSRECVAESGTGVDLVQGIGERLPFKSGSFDWVVCKGALDHFPDPYEC